MKNYLLRKKNNDFFPLFAAVEKNDSSRKDTRTKYYHFFTCFNNSSIRLTDFLTKIKQLLTSVNIFKIFKTYRSIYVKKIETFSVPKYKHFTLGNCSPEQCLL